MSLKHYAGAAFWISMHLYATAGVPVEGDAEALQLVRDVQAANLAAFPVGSARFHAVYAARQMSAKGVPTPGRETWEGQVLWEGSRSYSEHSYRIEVQNDSGEWVLSQRKQSMRKIYTPREEFVYLYGWTPKEAVKRFGNFSRRTERLAVMPNHAWYGPSAPYIARTWETLFDPEFNPKETEKIVVERPDAEHIVVSRVHRRLPPLRITCSAKVGGNVIRSEQDVWKDAPPGYASAGETNVYEWVPTNDGRFRLKRLECTWLAENAGNDDPVTSYVLEINEFDPNPAIPPDRFTFESLQIEPGTIVREYRDGIRSKSVFGKPVPAVTQEVLDRLAEEAKSKGFANPNP